MSTVGSVEVQGGTTVRRSKPVYILTSTSDKKRNHSYQLSHQGNRLQRRRIGWNWRTIKIFRFSNRLSLKMNWAI